MKEEKGFESLVAKVVALRRGGVRYYQACDDAIANGAAPPVINTSDLFIDAVDSRTLPAEPDAIEMDILKTLHGRFGQALMTDKGLQTIIRTFSIQGGRNLLHRMFMSDRHGDHSVRTILGDVVVPLKAVFDKNPSYFLAEATMVVRRFE
jgi:hypothetical protein